MDAEEFKVRYLRSVSDVADDLRDDVSAFVLFGADRLESEAVDLHARDWLSRVGLPADAGPWLSFSSESNYPEGLIPSAFFHLGATGYGDPICLEKASGRIVGLDHEQRMSPFLLNSGLAEFATFLCLFSEHFRSRRMHECVAEMKAVDAIACAESGFWVSHALQML